MMLSRVDLPQPEWPMIETNSPFVDRQRDVAQHFASLRRRGVNVLSIVIELQIGRA